MCTTGKLKHLFWLKLLVFLLFCGLSKNLAQAQSGISFNALSDAKEILVNNYFEVSFTLKNATGTDFSPPKFDNFIVLSGPNSSKSMQYINGQVSQEMGYSYTLQATKVGTFTIGSASIKVNGKTLKTTPLQIKVVKGNNLPNSQIDQKAYIVIIPNKTTSYPGEQILLDFKLYTTVSLDGYDILEEPEYHGFYVQELRRFNSFTQREVINGRQVTTKVLRRLALFPQQTGELIIPPASIQLAIIEDNNRSGFFFSRNIKPLVVTTEPITITVNELPPGPPVSFTGAVGNFSFQASVNRLQATTDDAISLTMIMTGNGDIKRVQPPPIAVSDSFELYPPRIVEEKTVEEQGELVNRKVLEYLVLPKFPGQYNLNASFTYFDTDLREYETIDSDPYRIIVKQGSDKHGSSPQISNTPEPTSDIRFIKTSANFGKERSNFVDSPLFWGLTAFPFIAFIGLFILKKSKSNNSQSDTSDWKTKHANLVSQQRLSIAKKHLDTSASRQFYDEISKASWGYVGDKLNIPLSQLSKNNIRDTLSASGVNQFLINDFLQIIQICEMALFAGKDNSQDMLSTYEKAVSVISKLEEEIAI